MGVHAAGCVLVGVLGHQVREFTYSRFLSALGGLALSTAIAMEERFLSGAKILKIHTLVAQFSYQFSKF